MLGMIGAILLGLFLSGIIFTFVVKLTTTVGAYLKKKIREHRRSIGATRFKELIQSFKAQKEKEAAENMMHELGEDALALWFEDETGEIPEDSIEIITGADVDTRTKKIFDMHDGYIEIKPSAV